MWLHQLLYTSNVHLYVSVCVSPTFGRNYLLMFNE